MEPTYIVRVTASEMEELLLLSHTTFKEAFAWGNTDANLQHYLNYNLSITKLTEELKNQESEFYFAKTNNRISGYLKINFAKAQTELPLGGGIEIERIYVLQQYHGKGIAQLLYQTALQRATELNAAFIWLGVWEKNMRAISFYKKLGFVEFDTHIFHLGDDAQLDIMMRKILK
ncbi:MAG: GNAT family N-acetyltransferase [Bacteroidetes bacterium]|nr:GNAT family N-acetyltransferase [Bacteroidota bacterium]